MNKLMTVALLLLMLGCTINKPGIIITSLSNTTSNPFDLLTIYSINTDLNADESYARFYNNDYDIKVPVLELNNKTITVSVPAYVKDDKFTKGNVNVQLIQVFNETTTSSNTLNLTINDLPLSKTETGWITLAYLRGIFNASMQLSNEVNASIYDTEEVGIELIKKILITGLLYPEINNVIETNKSYYMGSINNQPIEITLESLNNTDRLILALLNAQSKVALSEPEVVKFDSGDNTPGCMALEAKSLAEVVESGEPVAHYTSYYNAPIKSINCKTAEAFTDGFKVLMGSSAAALGLMSIAGAPAALASAGLMYINVEMGGGLILLGGSLGKETQGARELVLEGYERLSEAGTILKENTISKIEIDSFLSTELPEPFNDILDVWTSVSDLHELITNNKTTSKYVKLTVYRDSEFYSAFNVDKTGLNDWGSCTHECNMLYRKGETITIKSISDDLIFEGWSGDCTGAGNCILVMDSDKYVKAKYREDLVNLTINRIGDPYGTVTTNPGGLSDYGDCTGTCLTTFKRGSKVTLTGNDYGNAKFNQWGGDCSGSEDCKLVMDTDKTVLAMFNTGELVTLTINRQGTYYGTFNMDVSVIDSNFGTCSTSCTATLAKDTTVTLTPVETTGVTFTGWSGDCTGNGNCVIVMNANKTVTESFSQETTQTSEPVQTGSNELSVSMTSDFSTSVKASGSWGTECNYILTTSGTASGPIGAKIHVYAGGGEEGGASYTFSSWTKGSYGYLAQRESGQSESTTWTSSYTFSCIEGDYPIEVYATTSFIGPTGIYYSESTTTRYYDCTC